MTNEEVAYWQEVLMRYFKVDRTSVKRWADENMRVWVGGFWDNKIIDIPDDELSNYLEPPPDDMNT